jgi:hypothetical protein
MIKPKFVKQKTKTEPVKKESKKKKNQRPFIIEILLGIINWLLDSFRNLRIFHKNTVKEVKLKPPKRTKMMTQQNRMEMRKSKRIFMRPNRTFRTKR